MAVALEMGVKGRAQGKQGRRFYGTRKYVLLAVSIASVLLSIMLATSFAADKKVDCGKILTEIEDRQFGPSDREKMGISTSVVYRWEQKAASGQFNSISFQLPERYTDPFGAIALGRGVLAELPGSESETTA
jgi:hypothetical protein